ncbi:transposase, partial [Escherichia coli]|nr:transposase [Escherichia coli]
MKTCTIKRECGKWFVIFVVETSAEPLSKTGQSVGMDAGIESFMTLSDGSVIDNFKYFESAQKQLRKIQRKVARRKKGGNGRRKAVAIIQKAQAKIKNQRRDFHHKVSRSLVETYDVIAIEKLNILGLSKGILSKQVHDAAWGNFFLTLKSKAAN